MYEYGQVRVPADIRATLERVGREGMRSKTLSIAERCGSLDKARDILVSCRWNIAIAAKQISVHVRSLYEHVHLHHRNEWHAATNKHNRRFKHPHLYDRAVLMDAFTSCDWCLAATARKLKIDKYALRKIAYNVIPDEMKRNVSRANGYRIWRSYKLKPGLCRREAA
jgi:hypothetical protein